MQPARNQSRALLWSTIGPAPGERPKVEHNQCERLDAGWIGGLATSFVLELLIYPPIYELWKWKFMLKDRRADPATLAAPEVRGHS